MVRWPAAVVTHSKRNGGWALGGGAGVQTLWPVRPGPGQRAHRLHNCRTATDPSNGPCTSPRACFRNPTAPAPFERPTFEV